MHTTTRAIVLSAIRYGESSLVVKAFTASDGLKSYLLKGVLSSRKGKLRAGYFQPLMQLELVANHRSKGTLEYISEARIGYPYQSLHSDIAKSTLVFFLADILAGSIREEEANIPLFDFLETSLRWLDTHGKIANFHLFFLLELSKYLGFYPETRSKDAPYFDMVEGTFTGTRPPLPFLNGQVLEDFRAILGLQFETLHTMRLPKTDRQALLQQLVLYFEIHLQGFKKPRSLTVLYEIFD